MDEFFLSDLAMLDEEHDEEVLSNNLDSSLDDSDDRVSILQNSQHYRDIMQKLEDDTQVCELPDDEHFQLVVDASALSVKLEDEIVHEYNFIRDLYRAKFPELESLVHHPVDYARVVKMIGNETDLTQISGLKELLPSAMVMVVSLTASTTSGKPLPQEVLEKTLEGCDRAIELDSTKMKILGFLESQALKIAPNLLALVGSAVAAKLIAAVGSLEKLANRPACDVQLLGAPKKSLVGFSRKSRVGYIEQTEVIQSTPPSLREKVSRVLAAKVSLAARMDFVKGDSTGQFGSELLKQVRKKIEKMQELPTPRIQKILPVPNEPSRTKKKRGGRRLRKMKERYEVTEMRMLANRMKFNVPEESTLGDGFGVGFGMLGQDGCGKLHVSATSKKLKLSKKHKEKLASYGGGRSRMEVGSSSSLAITPVLGVELPNRLADGDQDGRGMQSTYFSESAAFLKIRN